MFLLLEAQEASVRGAPESPVVSYLPQCLSFFLQSARINDSVRTRVEDKILDYFDKNTPLNAAKISAKIVESVVCTNPDKLDPFLKVLLNNETVSNSYAAEKVAFRIRLSAGACKQASSQKIKEQLDGTLLASIFTSPVRFRIILLEKLCNGKQKLKHFIIS